MNTWLNVDGEAYDEAINLHKEGSNVLIAMQLYDAGGGSVESLSEDWELTTDQKIEFSDLVKQGWKEGRWPERRINGERRET